MARAVENAAHAAERIGLLRRRLGLTQAEMAKRLGVSFVSLNRWENGQTVPSALSWRQVEALEAASRASSMPPEGPLGVDFAADPEIVRTLVEGERLSFGHLANAGFGAEISLIHPLPHQREAVYRHMLPQMRLRFLLADDAGAGKTIMAGLYVREMLGRRRLRRVLVVCPAGLTGNWRRELGQLFGLDFSVFGSGEAGNPFTGGGSDRVIVSVDTLAGERAFGLLAAPEVEPYDLVIFDEAHKLSVRQEGDHGLRRTDRYRLAEALCGANGRGTGSLRLGWSARNVLLLTATPHMGKDLPYAYLWRLLRPDAIPTLEAWRRFPRAGRARHFLRRTKEEMVNFGGEPLYPVRLSRTFGFPLASSADPAQPSEQRLYDRTSAYLRGSYNRARILDSNAAGLALGVFQRRLASSAYALLCSLERRRDKLDQWIAAARKGEKEALVRLRSQWRGLRDLFESETADEEPAAEGREANEGAEDRILAAVVAASLEDLEKERAEVSDLIEEAQAVLARGEQAKYGQLCRALMLPEFRGEKVIIFTEHRDTLRFLQERLEGQGFAGQIAHIHGGMAVEERERQVETFRGPARLLLATDAAGEGINLQFCWLVVNYDIPWNPARLEQRMGRVHRYGQRHDPVHIVNLVADQTREGKVLATLLRKLEAIKAEHRAFDVVGRMLGGASLRGYMEAVLRGRDPEEVCAELGEKVSDERAGAVLEQERRDYGAGETRDTAALERERAQLRVEEQRRLLPGYVRGFLERALPALEMEVTGSLGGEFGLRPRGAGGAAWAAIEGALSQYAPERRGRMVLQRPERGDGVAFIRPGEAVFEAVRQAFTERWGREARRGAVYVDPMAERPYLLHLATARTERAGGGGTESARLLAVRQEADGAVRLVAPEALLLLRGGGTPGRAQELVARAGSLTVAAAGFAASCAAEEAARQRAAMAEVAAEWGREDEFGLGLLEAELAGRRRELSKRAAAEAPSAQAGAAMELVRAEQRRLGEQRLQARAAHAEAGRSVVPGGATMLTLALVLPSRDAEERRRYDAAVEQAAVRAAIAHEQARGGVVRDVSTAALAVAAGLGEHPGFDLWSRRPDGTELAIEVKGRAGVGEVELSENEWRQAANRGAGYWLYVAFHCASPAPSLFRVRDPFAKLMAQRGGALIDAPQIQRHAETERS